MKNTRFKILATLFGCLLGTAILPLSSWAVSNPIVTLGNSGTKGVLISDGGALVQAGPISGSMIADASLQPYLIAPGPATYILTTDGGVSYWAVAPAGGGSDASVIVLSGDTTGNSNANTNVKMQGQPVSATTVTTGQFFGGTSAGNYGPFSTTGDVSCSAVTPGLCTITSLGSASAILVTGPGLNFVSTQVAPKIGQTLLGTDGGVSSPLLIAAQSNPYPTGTGGTLILSAGTGGTINGDVQVLLGGAGSALAEDYLTIKRDGGTIVQIGSLPSTVTPNGAIYFGGVTPLVNNYAISGTSTVTNINSGTTTNLNAGGGSNISLTSSSASFSQPITINTTVGFGSALASASISQATLVDGGTGATLTISAQSNAYPNGTGGNLNLSSGAGSDAGVINLQSGSTTVASITSSGIRIPSTTTGIQIGGANAVGDISVPYIQSGTQNVLISTYGGSGTTNIIDINSSNGIIAFGGYAAGAGPGISELHGSTNSELVVNGVIMVNATSSAVAIGQPMIGYGTSPYNANGYSNTSIAGGAQTTVLVPGTYNNHFNEFTGAITGNQIVQYPSAANGASWAACDSTTGVGFTVTAKCTSDPGPGVTLVHNNAGIDAGSLFTQIMCDPNNRMRKAE